MIYSGYRLHGQGKFNYVLSTKSDDTWQDILNRINGAEDKLPIWNEDTTTLSKFKNIENPLSASDYGTFYSAVSAFSVQKSYDDSDTLYSVGTANQTDGILYDYNIRSKSKVRYYVTPISLQDDTEFYGSYVMAEPIETEFQYIEIMGLFPTYTPNEYTPDLDNIWKFRFNIDSISYRPQWNKIITPNISKYPKDYVTAQDYLEVSFSCTLGDIECPSGEFITPTIDKLNGLRAFLHSGNLKLYKDFNSHTFPCDITDFSYDIGNDGMVNCNITLIQLNDEHSIAVYNTEVAT